MYIYIYIYMYIYIYIYIYDYVWGPVWGAVWALCSLCGPRPAWRHLLATVLFAGNHLNEGTDRGKAHGFSLDTLEKMQAVRSTGPIGNPHRNI